MRNLEEFRAKYPMSRKQFLFALQGQEDHVNWALSQFRFVSKSIGIPEKGIDYARDMLALETDTMKALLAYV